MKMADSTKEALAAVVATIVVIAGFVWFLLGAPLTRPQCDLSLDGGAWSLDVTKLADCQAQCGLQGVAWTDPFCVCVPDSANCARLVDGSGRRSGDGGTVVMGQMTIAKAPERAMTGTTLDSGPDPSCSRDREWFEYMNRALDCISSQFIDQLREEAFGEPTETRAKPFYVRFCGIEALGFTDHFCSKAHLRDDLCARPHEIGAQINSMNRIVKNVADAVLLGMIPEQTKFELTAQWRAARSKLLRKMAAFEIVLADRLRAMPLPEVPSAPDAGGTVR